MFWYENIDQSIDICEVMSDTIPSNAAAAILVAILD